MESIQSDARIKTARLVLREIQPEDVTPDYVDWLNRPEINRHLEVRHERQDRDSVVKFVEQKRASKNARHFGVFDQDGSRLVGTVTLPNIDWNHRFSDISFVIGHPDAQGRGYGTEAVHAVCDYMFKNEGLNKIWAAYYDGHRGSARIFEKNGFEIEGRFRKKILFEGKRVDRIVVGILADEFVPSEKYLGESIRDA